jgi:hypothetical protein
MNDKYKLLRKKEIIEILDGDKELGESEQIKLPYLSGPQLCELSQSFGLHQEYFWGNGGNNLSRWQYMDKILEYCIEKNKINELLLYMTSKNRFEVVFKGLSREEIEENYELIINKFIEKINGILYFSGNEFIFTGKQYIIREIGVEVEISAPSIKIIDREYIKDLSERALKDIDEDNLDSAITKARTILEETFCYVIERKNVEPIDNGEINKLYKQVKELYNMHSDGKTDKRINNLLSGLEKIVSSIAEMRNKGSDSHGLGDKRINISSYHARLCVNSAVVMADFIISIYQFSEKE